MLLLVLILVLLAFGLLLVGWLTSSVLVAWVSVAVSVVAAVVLVVDNLQRRSAVRAGDRHTEEAAPGTPRRGEPTVQPADGRVPDQRRPGPPGLHGAGFGGPGFGEVESATEVIPVVRPQGRPQPPPQRPPIGVPPGASPASWQEGPSGRMAPTDGASPAASDPPFDPAADSQHTIVMPVVQPSGSSERPFGAGHSVTPSSGSSSPTVINRGSDASDSATADPTVSASGKPAEESSGGAPEPSDSIDGPTRAVRIDALSGAPGDGSAPEHPGSGAVGDESHDSSVPGSPGGAAPDALPARAGPTTPAEEASSSAGAGMFVKRPAGRPGDPGASDVASPNAGSDSGPADGGGADSRPGSYASDGPSDGSPSDGSLSGAPSSGERFDGSVTDHAQADARDAVGPDPAGPDSGPPRAGAPDDSTGVDAGAGAVASGPTGGSGREQPGGGVSSVGETDPAVDLSSPARSSAEQSFTGEPPEEPHLATAALVVARLEDEVIVIDEQPRYHLAECPSLVSAEPIPLPAREAVELGFTPCGWCTPDRVLAERHSTSVT